MRRRLPILLLWLLSITAFAQPPEIRWAKIQSEREAVILSAVPLESQVNLHITPPMEIAAREQRGDTLIIRTQTPFRLDEHYYVNIPGRPPIFLQPDGVLDQLYSEKTLGFSEEDGQAHFRLFAPRARWVKLLLFEEHLNPAGRTLTMVRDPQGVWEIKTPLNPAERYYGYKVWGPQGEGEMFDSTIVLADPYSRAVVTRNHYTHPARSLIPHFPAFDWQGDTWQNIPASDLIIYEMHVRDLTAHPSSGVPEHLRGSYAGLVVGDQRGGLPYIRNLGVNAVELLPTQDFGNMEIPYLDSTISGHPVNTWNPYARNHWGYMTSYFFAPESYYASGGTMQPGAYNGVDGRQVNEFKQMVKTFHQNGMAVLMDVVYNHVSQYDYNPLKYIDKFYYFRTLPNGDFESLSGCGNDLKTERPMARRLIVESVLHWMEEYHVDGFRFDLATLIDWETIDAIRAAAQKVNPDVILIAEAWHWGGYAPDQFSDHGWAAWNDQIRNAVKGQNPRDGLGFIFGEFQGNNTPATLRNYLLGNLRSRGGLFNRAEHSVNYLESHDDHTLGDFIRLGLREVDEKQRITDVDQHARLSTAQLRANKLAAMFLLLARGPVMIAEGQEFARSKVIAKTDAPDSNWGRIDHNSYEKDNPTNWLNFDHAGMNVALVDYYRSLIQLRKRYPELHRSRPEAYRFYDNGDPLLIRYELEGKSQRFLVALNGNPNQTRQWNLPGGKWFKLADERGVYPEEPLLVKENRLTIPPTSGIILIYGKQ